MSSNSNNHEQSEGAASLSGLFSPPPGSSSSEQKSPGDAAEHATAANNGSPMQQVKDVNDTFRFTGQPRSESDRSVDEYANESAGTLTHLTNLFQQQRGAAGTGDAEADDNPSPWHKKHDSVIYEEETEEQSPHPMQRRSTKKGSNTSSERTALLQQSQNQDSQKEYPPTSDEPSNDARRLSSQSYDSTDYYGFNYSPGFHGAKTPHAGPTSRKQELYNVEATQGVLDASLSMPQHAPKGTYHSIWAKAADIGNLGLEEITKPTTWIGAFMFVLYHIVFTLAAGSAIRRPHATTSILGLMTKAASLGIIFAG